MKLLKPILILLLLLNATIVFSASNTVVSGKITYFNQWTSGLLIKLDGNNDSNPAGCSVAGSYFLNISADPSTDNTTDSYIAANDNYKFMKAILLASKMNNQRVQLTIYGNACLSNRPRIISVKLL